RPVEAGPGGLDRVGRVGAVDRNADLGAELLELVDRGWTLEVGGDEARLAAPLLQLLGELRRGGRLARALKAREQDHRARAELELGRVVAEEVGELLVDDLDDVLAGGKSPQHLFAERALAHPVDEAADDLEVDVGFEQREPDLAHRARDRLVVELALAAQVAEGTAQAVGKGVEHGTPVYWGASGRPSTEVAAAGGVARTAVTSAVVVMRIFASTICLSLSRQGDGTSTMPRYHHRFT